MHHDQSHNGQDDKKRPDGVEHGCGAESELGEDVDRQGRTSDSGHEISDDKVIEGPGEDQHR